MSDGIVVRNEGSVCRIELDRADCGNLVTSAMVVTIANAFQALPAGVKVVVFSGRGNDFCKGRDYSAAPESAQGGKAPSALEIRRNMTDPIVSMYAALKECPLPTVSVVQGLAHGFGCALAGACDIVLAGNSARFRLPEMTKGLPPTLAMTALWERISTRGLAYLVYSTAEIDAPAAQAMGLVSTVVADDALASQAAAVVEAIAQQPADAIRAVKEYLTLAPSMPAAGRAGLGAGLFAAVLSSR
ncbi:MAG: enoyl-CoA hydratase/isomerase family protein [Burkholderiales bacterium]